jgi:hypothetical protein
VREAGVLFARGAQRERGGGGALFLLVAVVLFRDEGEGRVARESVLAQRAKLAKLGETDGDATAVS